MKTPMHKWIAAACLIVLAGQVYALEQVKIAVLLANRPKQDIQAHWTPLVAAMNKAIPGYDFIIEVYDYNEMQEVVATRQADFVITNPSHYLLMLKRSGLTTPLVTLSNLEQGKSVNAFGGVIFSLAGRPDLVGLADLRGKLVAVTSSDTMGGFQMQAYELSRVGLNPHKDIRLLNTGQPHSGVLEAVLSRRADAGFVRSGILEEFAKLGKLDLNSVAIINQQNLPDFPVKVSTRLYPEWPLAALPQTSNYLKRKVAAFLLTLHENTELVQKLKINGFDVPSNYLPVEDMLRELHLPPYDIAPVFTVSDVWKRYRWPIIASTIAVLLFLLLGFNTWLTNRRLRDRSRDLNNANLKMQNEIVERKLMEEQISDLAFYDPLTGLPNRRLLMDRLSSALSASSRNEYYGALLFVDLDHFKVLNDTLGHDIGDLLLIEVAIRIQASLRETDTVARLGGDEFVMLIEKIDQNAEAASNKVVQIAEKIRSHLSEPYILGNHIQYSTPSIGVSLYLGIEKSVDVLLKCADIALYQAKSSGRNLVRFFDPAMQQAVEAHAAIEADLRQAITEGQLLLFYQIQMDSDLRPIGAEALLRWVHPVRGMVSPMLFIPVAEESRLILDIGTWVLETACSQLRLWSADESKCNLSIAVNVSAHQFRQPEFPESIAQVLRKYELEPSRLKLELTESVVLGDVADVVRKMYALKAIGVTLSMDDFGTGYSSLSYLKQLPLDQLKIDQSFVRDMITDPNDAVMVKTVIDMAHNFRLNVIAEGVETEAQMEMLKQMGCKAYQGYFFSKPVPVEQFEILLK